MSLRLSAADVAAASYSMPEQLGVMGVRRVGGAIGDALALARRTFEKYI